MRISVRPYDSGYDPRLGWDVTVNGKQVPLCYTASEEEGAAYCYEPGADGRPFIDPNEPTKAKEIVYRGVVKITRPPTA